MNQARSHTAATGPGASAWDSVHCYLRWTTGDVDRFLHEVVDPTLDELRGSGRIADWFFIRYAADGPHLRIRIRDARPGATEELRDRLGVAVRNSPYLPVPDRPGRPAGWLEHGVTRTATYEPETMRYGGPEALAVAEDVFCRASEIALSVIAATPDRARRLAAATDLTMATAHALDLAPKDAARWLRTNAYTWRWHRRDDMIEPSRVQNSALAAASGQGPALVRRWSAIGDVAACGDGSVGRWATTVRNARHDLEREGPDPCWLGVWASQLHMLCNRLGLLPDEERTLSWFVASCLLGADGPIDYFADDVAAADRRYLDASRYVLATMPDQQPRDVPPPPPLIERNPFAGPAVPLPAAELPAVPLRECLAQRRTARGDLGSTITAAELGTVLWSAYAPVRPQETVRWGAGDAEFSRRPYPSAGAQFTARLRVIARCVDGVEPGLYGVDPNGRALVPQAALPSAAELVASSMWLVDSAPAHDRVDVTRLPALVGVYIALGALRVRYGLRAMRFALLEAGHLAQTLALCATAAGLTVGTIGGFYDDVAHELFMLDGVDDVLVYLMPIGRSR